jgi:hypothetical protein
MPPGRRRAPESEIAICSPVAPGRTWMIVAASICGGVGSGSSIEQVVPSAAELLSTIRPPCCSTVRRASMIAASMSSRSS